MPVGGAIVAAGRNNTALVCVRLAHVPCCYESLLHSLPCQMPETCTNCNTLVINRKVSMSNLKPLAGRDSECITNRQSFWLAQVEAVNKVYPGRASVSPSLDLLITLLHLGAHGVPLMPHMIVPELCGQCLVSHRLGPVSGSFVLRTFITPRSACKTRLSENWIDLMDCPDCPAPASAAGWQEALRRREALFPVLLSKLQAFAERNGAPSVRICSTLHNDVVHLEKALRSQRLRWHVLRPPPAGASE